MPVSHKHSDSLPVAYCWVCKAETLVHTEFPDGRPVRKCLVCDQRLEAWGVDPGCKRIDVASIADLGLEVYDRSATGGGCESGGCLERGGGGGCWTPAVEGRAAEVAAEGLRGCASCGVKTECADVARLSREGDLDGARAASAKKLARKRALEQA